MLSNPPQTTLDYGGRLFELEGESRWSVQYRHEKNILVLSKLFYDTFDWSFFETTSPEDLRGIERYHAAVAIYGVKDSRIPQTWEDHAIKLCGPGCTPPTTWDEINEK
jgi:hypothetical protein